MHRTNYTKEVGLDVPEGRVSWPVTGVLLATAGVALWFGLRDVQARAARYHESARLAIAAEKTAHPTLVRK